jgi:histidinol-phosphate aminotransferase
MWSERMKKLIPYVPGEQPQDRKYLKLNTNENPYPPSKRIKDFLQDFDIERLRLYPDPRFSHLREKLAARYQVEKEQVFVSNGSDEMLSFAFYAFFDSERGPLIFPEITYSFYPVYCDFYGIEYQKIPLNTDFSIDIDRFIKKTPSCGVIFANPNTPTGICLPLEKISYLLENYPQDKVVIVDEAYIDFGGVSALGLIRKYQNLLIVRTFSKSMALAGLRLGFAIGDQGLIEALFVVKDSFNSYPADMLSQLIGEVALMDEDYYGAITENIIATRDYFSSQLMKLGWNVLPSKANFIFAEKAGMSGEEVYRILKEKGILVRYFHINGIESYVRITIGKRDEMERLIEEVRHTF